jgi:hypothetical protein
MLTYATFLATTSGHLVQWAEKREYPRKGQRVLSTRRCRSNVAEEVEGKVFGEATARGESEAVGEPSLGKARTKRK